MKADLEWTDYTPEGIKRKVRITFSGKKSIKWQFKRADESHWDYDRQPTQEEWALLEKRWNHSITADELNMSILNSLKNCEAMHHEHLIYPEE